MFIEEEKKWEKMYLFLFNRFNIKQAEAELQCSALNLTLSRHSVMLCMNWLGEGGLSIYFFKDCVY